MLIVLIIIVIAQILSLLGLWINIKVFRAHAQKLEDLFDGFESKASWEKPGRILIPLYVTVTMLAAIITTAIFIFQPHIL